MRILVPVQLRAKSTLLENEEAEYSAGQVTYHHLLDTAKAAAKQVASSLWTHSEASLSLWYLVFLQPLLLERVD